MDIVEDASKICFFFFFFFHILMYHSFRPHLHLFLTFFSEYIIIKAGLQYCTHYWLLFASLLFLENGETKCTYVNTNSFSFFFYLLKNLCQKN